MSINARVEKNLSYDHEKVRKVIESVWPRVFGDKYLPLEINIKKKMWKVLRGIPGSLTKQELKKYLRLYCSSPGYRACLANGGARFGLDGEVAGVVSQSQQDRARSEGEHVALPARQLT